MTALLGGIDIAAHDAMGKLLNLSVAELIGRAAALHFLAALPSYPHADHVSFPPLLEYDVGENRLQNEIFVAPIRFADGWLDVPTGPGLGVTLDQAALRRFGAA